MDNAVERALECIRKRYSEPLTLTEIAESALLSRFYFTRLFKEETGLTPGRFLAATRIQQAKLLIETTSMSITEISFAVGYNSLGSFTNSFTAGVGMSPSRFRRLSRHGAELPPAPDPDRGAGMVAGTISLPEGRGDARVYLGAFRTPIVQHPSAAAILIDVPSGRPSCYSLRNVPEGEWHLLAVAVADGIGPAPRDGRTSLIGRHGPVIVGPEGVTSAAVRLRPAQPTDPPVLLALPTLEPVPPVRVRPGCASVTPEAHPVERARLAGHFRPASPAPVPTRP